MNLYSVRFTASMSVCCCDLPSKLEISPKLSVLSPAESIALLKERLSHSLETRHVRQLNELRRQLDCPEEWTTDIHKIVEHARQNNITPLELEKMGKRSAESLLSYFPQCLRSRS